MPLSARLCIMSVLIISVLLAACGPPRETSENVSDSLLSEVLSDLHELEAAKQLIASADSVLLSPEDIVFARTETRDSILAVHGLTDSDFMAAMNPFLEEPSKYVVLYNRVLDNLMQRAQSSISQDE